MVYKLELTKVSSTIIIRPKCGQQVGFDQKCGLQFIFYQSVAHKLGGTLILEEIADGMNEFQEACRSAA